MNPSITDEYEVTTLKGKRILRITDRAIYDDNSNIIEYQSVGKDITEQKKAEQFLKESESKYRTLFETANDAIFILERSYYVDCNIQAVKLLNVESKDDIIGRNLSDFSPERQPDGLYSKEKASKIIQLAIEGEPQFFQWRIMLPSKKLVDVEVNLNSFQSLDKKLLIAIVRDITERKKAEEKIKKSLKEKEVLLREVHHRVKNNLQIISSIINLQANNTKVEEIKMIIKEIRNRILSMALIHEKLYQSDNIAKVDFATYVRSLIRGLFSTYAVTEKKIKIDIDIYDVQLNLDFVVPCGLIINEVVSNSIKYAFPGDMSGRIKVSFQPSEDGKGFVLDIIDNGVGMPGHIDFNKTETLGLRLIRALITQLNGKVSIDRATGTHYHIEFKSKWYL
jgi:PAS domain S-box-containing protein